MKPMDRALSKTYVVTMLSNPRRFLARVRNYQRFAHQCACAGAQLVTVEVAFGDRPFEVTTDDKFHIRLRSSNELWLKENALNIAISRLPFDWQYVAWIDADVAFSRDDWLAETVHLLQHYMVIQMFSTSEDLGPQYQPLRYRRSFMASYSKLGHVPSALHGGYSGMDWQTGYAWAARREAIEHLGGLIDWNILGAGDWQMAFALVGDVQHAMNPHLHPAYLRMAYEWQARAERYIRRNVSFMPGLLLHYFHGKMRDRQYGDRWRALLQYQFNPLHDLKRDSQGLWQLVDDGSVRSMQLRDAIRAYFLARNEDSTEAD
jgi:hypothetical protein